MLEKQPWTLKCRASDPANREQLHTGEQGKLINLIIFRDFSTFLIFFGFFYFFIKYLGRQRDLEGFLEPMASFSQSMSPWRATATHFMSKITSNFRSCTSQITYVEGETLFFEFLVPTMGGQDPSNKMRIEILRGGYGGSIYHNLNFKVGILYIIYSNTLILGATLPGRNFFDR